PRLAAAQLLVLHLLLQLLLELLRLTAEHLLLPPVLRRLLFVLALLLGEFLLPFGKLLQLFQRFVDLLLLRIAALLSALAGAFILILLGVELEIEEALHVACRAAATASPAAAALSKCHLDIAE